MIRRAVAAQLANYSKEVTVAEPAIRIVPLDARNDGRGVSFVPPDDLTGWIAPAVHVHAMTLRPGSVRGNHYHERQHEHLLVMYQDAWSLRWQTERDAEVHCREFSGAGAVLVAVDPLVAHAVRNDGHLEMYILSFSDHPYDPKHPDSQRRTLIE